MSTMSPTQTLAHNIREPMAHPLEKSIVLLPFGLSWPIFGYLQNATKEARRKDAELRLLLVMSHAEEATADTAEARYTLLRSLHDYMQGLPITFSIETAVGPLVETAVAYAASSDVHEILLVDMFQSKTGLTTAIKAGAPCKTTVLHLN